MSADKKKVKGKWTWHHMVAMYDQHKFPHQGSVPQLTQVTKLSHAGLVLLYKLQIVQVM